MKNISKALLLVALSTMTVMSVNAAEVWEVDLNKAANNVDMEWIKVNDYESGDVEMGDTKINSSEWTVDGKDQKVDAEAGTVEQDGKVIRWEGTDMEGNEKLGKVKWQGVEASWDMKAENTPDLNAAPAKSDDMMAPTALPKTWAEEILILFIALMLWAMFMMKSKKTS